MPAGVFPTMYEGISPKARPIAHVALLEGGHRNARVCKQPVYNRRKAPFEIAKAESCELCPPGGRGQTRDR